MLATAAALILGVGPHGAGVLKPGSLEPRCRLPARMAQVDVSPNGRYLAVGDDRGLHIRAARSCRRLGDYRIRTSQRVISWLARDRVLIVKRGKPTTVRAVDPFAGKVVHREKLRERLGDTARVGSRQVVLSDETLRVFGAGGAIERTVPLPGAGDGTLHGASPLAGKALVLAGATAYVVDVATGEVTEHTVPPGRWIEPQIPGMLAVGDNDAVSILDPQTFAVTRVVHPGSQLKGAGAGFISVADEGDAPLKAYGADGELLWSRKLNILDASAFRGRVYAGSGYDHVRIRVYDLASGRRERVIRGRAYLFEASHGRVAVPYFTNQAIVED